MSGTNKLVVSMITEKKGSNSALTSALMNANNVAAAPKKDNKKK